MRKNSGPIISAIEIDVDGNYVLPLPEYIVNDLGWYESTEVVITIDGNELVITDLETYENFWYN